jgi:hypothetical protein
MVRAVRGVVGLCALVASLGAGAQRAGVIAGGVYDDQMALAVRRNFVPAAGVAVKLYRDGGDRTPTADDALFGTATTDDQGVYVFPTVSAGDYWVVVDSRSFARGAWPEQTFGPAGSLCARTDGSTAATYFEGTCIGGRTFGSDDASALVTSEHVALVTPSDAASRVDFAFSFNVVTTTADGENLQGSFRQFLANANRVDGSSRMRFVPLQQAPEQRQVTMGTPLRWWSIVLATPLPELHDADTVIDGTAYSYLSPASVANPNPGAVGEKPTLKPEERSVPHIDKPELELTLTGPTGILCSARCGIRAIAMHGSPTNVITRADARIEQVMIGASPDAVSAEAGEIGLQVEGGVTVARFLLVTTQTRVGVLVGAGARLDGERLEVSRCGDPRSGGGIVLLSDGSSIRASNIATNAGAGIILGSLDGATPAHGNTIDGSTISGNQAGILFGAGSSRNTIVRNDIMWNRLGGVTSAPYERNAPRENRVSANRFDENGLRPIILNLGAANPNELAAGAVSCDRVNDAVNSGILPPRVTDVRVVEETSSARVTIRGKACPGEIVELYQSYVTTGVRDKKADMPRIRNEKADARETLTAQEREMALPSVGEFNYLGAANTSADGTFEASFPLPTLQVTQDDPRNDEETKIWAREVLPNTDPADRAFSAIAIDKAGNTSEMSVRRKVD